MKAGERLEQNRFARSRSTRDADDLAGQDIEADLVMHHLLAEAVDDAARGKKRLAVLLLPGAHIPSFSNRLENNASSTITTKIALTTARGVSPPTLSADPRTLRPCMQPITAIRKPKIGALKKIGRAHV